MTHELLRVAIYVKKKTRNSDGWRDLVNYA